MMLENNFRFFYRTMMRFGLMLLLGIALFSLIRIIHLFSYGNLAELSKFKMDLIHAFWVGLRYDATVLAHGFIAIFILNLLVLFPPCKTEKSIAAINRITCFYTVFIFMVYIAILIVDFFFYLFFQSHINKLVFGILNEPAAVLTSVWTDYPVTGVIVLYAGVMILLVYAVKKLFSIEFGSSTKSMTYRLPAVAVFLFLYLLALRGSTGAFPISRHIDSYISANFFINDLTLNGVFSLKEAFAERLSRKDSLNLPPLLRQSSFLSYHSSQEVYDTELRKYLDDAIDPERLPLAQTPENEFLKENPPHVVFVLMESMSNHYLDFHSQELNLLGSLEAQLKDCFVFRNFLPTAASTAQSLLGLMINNPDISFIDAQYNMPEMSFLSSVALPYAKAGYETTFATGQGLEWISLDKFVPRQYFQSVAGRDRIFSDIEGAQGSKWEVFDEFLFEYISRKLESSQGTPQFVFAMSVSNHTPFDIPSGYQPFSLKIPPELTKKIKTSEEVAIRNFRGYQYANHSLGKFIERVRSSDLGENTIIVATGDHSILQLFNYSYTRLFEKLSVPLIVYLPEKYLPPGNIDTSRFASHKDIFPTLFNLSLSKAHYLKTGNSLFDTSLTGQDYFAIFDNRIAMNKEGIILLEENPAYYTWEDRSTHLIKPTTLVKSPELKELLKRSAAYRAQMNFLSHSEQIKTDGGKKYSLNHP